LGQRVKRFPDIFLGALLAVAIFAIGFVFGSLPHSGSSAQNESAAKTGNTSNTHIEQKNWWNDPVANFTLGLVFVGLFQVGLFYVQLRFIRESLDDAKIAADAAKQSADAAKLQAETARDTLKTMQDTAERQLRAYLIVAPSLLIRISPNEKLQFVFTQINSGDTPGFNATHSGVMLLTDHPLPENSPFPELPPERPSRTGLAPKLPFNGSIVATRQFTQDELITILEGQTVGKRLYFFGHIDYTDAFGKEHWNRFCYSFPGRHDWILLAQQGRWADIAAIQAQPGFQMLFEAANQHNTTDQG